MIRTIILILAALNFVGCATVGKPVSELRQNVASTLFIQHGQKPLSFSTGVIDTSSFWGAYGDGVSTQTGGWLWSDLASSGRKETNEKRLTNAELVERLYADHQLTQTISDDVLPALSDFWGQQYSNSKRIIIDENSISIDPKSKIVSGLNADTDLVLMVNVRNIKLTERFSMGAALKSGFTLGTNKKSLTTEVTVVMHAFKSGQEGEYKEVWSQPCGTNYTTMKTSYYMEELFASKAKMTEILDEATTQSIESCTNILSKLASK